MTLLRRLLELVGRSLELALTGQTDFAVVTSELQDFAYVADLPKAQRLLAETRLLLERDFGIRLQAPVLVELFAPPDPLRRLTSPDRLGWYRPHALGERTAHTIFAQRGLSRARFKAILAHEMTHAYEREQGFLKSDRALREGFARWVEYKVLIHEGARTEACRVAGIRNWRFGRGVRTLLEMEKRAGVRGVMSYVSAIP